MKTADKTDTFDSQPGLFGPTITVRPAHEEDRTVVNGYTFLIARHWGGPTNSELKNLMLEHAFKAASTVWFHIGSGNLRSRRAVEKLGAQLSHELVIEAGGKRQVVLHYRLRPRWARG